MKAIISAGGTGGHIIPAVAVLEALEMRKVETSYIGNLDSMEEWIVKSKNHKFYSIHVQKLYRKFTLSHIKFPFLLLKSVIDSILILKKFKPDYCVLAGGYVCGPVGIASILLKIPFYLIEQNSFPGITNRSLGKYAKQIFLGYKNAHSYFPKGKTLLTGNPINTTIMDNSEPIDPESLGLKKDTPKLFIVGGSQGSAVMNDLVLHCIDSLLDLGLEIIWQTGKNHLQNIRKMITEKQGVYVFDFSNNIGKLYDLSTYAVARAGALTLAELETKKIPSILIPLPTAAANHQYYNAKEQEEKGIALVLEQKNATPLSLLEVVKKLMQSSINIENIRSIHLNAAATIADTIINNNKKES